MLGASASRLAKRSEGSVARRSSSPLSPSGNELDARRSWGSAEHNER